MPGAEERRAGCILRWRRSEGTFTEISVRLIVV